MDKRAFSIGHSLLVYIRHCDSGHENGFVYSGVLIIHLPEAEQNFFLGKKNQSKSWRQYPIGLQKMSLRRYFHL